MSTSQFLVRLPLDDHNKLKAAAKADGVSLNTWALGVLLAELDAIAEPTHAAPVISPKPQHDIIQPAPKPLPSNEEQLAEAKRMREFKQRRGLM